MHAKSVVSSHHYVGLTPLIYLLLASFPSSSTQSLGYQENMLCEKLMKYGPF